MTDASAALADYIEAARHRLAGLQGPGEGSWRDVLEQGLGDALSRGDISGLSRVVQLLVHLLEAQGRFDDALREIDAALLVATGHSNPTASLWALKAAMLIGRGNATEAASLASRAAALAGDMLDEHERLKTLTLCQTVSLQTFEVPAAAIDELVSNLVAAGRWQDQLFLLSWLIPALVAVGRIAEIGPRLRAMAAVARAQSAHFRSADVAAFQAWAGLIAGPGPTPLLLNRELSLNAAADWRIRCLETWRIVSRRQWALAPRALASVEVGQTRAGGHIGFTDAWSRLVETSMGGAGGSALPPPPAHAATLANLGSSLVVANCAALGGTTEEAAAWLDWIMRIRRSGVESSLECPLSVRRVQGLLSLRTGKPAAARRHLDDAAAWCASAGLQLEAAIARLQSLELKRKMFATSGGMLDGEIAAASSALSALAIDPVPIRYVVANAWDVGGNRPRSGVLTSREKQILARLADGLSYRESAEALGVAPATVQTMAHRIYSKLGVHRRLDALREARRFGLI